MRLLAAPAPQHWIGLKKEKEERRQRLEAMRVLKNALKKH
jgi:hypothetical protein